MPCPSCPAGKSEDVNLAQNIGCLRLPLLLFSHRDIIELPRVGIPIIQAVASKEGSQSRYTKDLLGFHFLPEMLLSELISDF